MHQTFERQYEYLLCHVKTTIEPNLRQRTAPFQSFRGDCEAEGCNVPVGGIWLNVTHKLSPESYLSWVP